MSSWSSSSSPSFLFSSFSSPPPSPPSVRSSSSSVVPAPEQQISLGKIYLDINTLQPNKYTYFIDNNNTDEEKSAQYDAFIGNKINKFLENGY